MKKVILLSLLISTTLLNAQNWRPLNPNDNKTHFKCLQKVTFSLNINNSVRSFNPIQTVNVTSRVSDSIKQILNFSKGININLLEKSINPNWSRYYQIIKGKVFGDSAVFYSDSSLFFTSDTKGFNLIFHNNYYGALGNKTIIGKNNSQGLILKARTNFYSYNSVLQDSTVNLTLLVYDSLNTFVFHRFNQHQIVLSKNNGIIKTIDFTQLDSVFDYERANNLPAVITKQIDNSLTTGDEYYYQESYFGNLWQSPPPYTGFRQFRRVILSDITNNNIRTIQMRETMLGGSSGSASHQITTNSFNINDTVFESNSGIINPNAQIPSNSYNAISMFSNDLIILGLCQSTSLSELVSYSSSSFNFNGGTDSLNKFNFEGGNHRLRLVGIDYSEQKYSRSTVSSNDYRKDIVYIKKNGQTWGTKPFLYTGINDALNEVKIVSFYPNPTSDKFSVKTDLEFQKIEIRDLNGRLVLDQNFSKQIDVSNLESGIYFIKLVGEKSITEKFIKN